LIHLFLCYRHENEVQKHVEKSTILVVNGLNAISENFLHDILTFTLKEAYTNKRKRNVKDRFRYLNHEVSLLIFDNYIKYMYIY
jgi:hypothetical protein